KWLACWLTDIRNQAGEYPYKVAKLPVNRNLNRYRDVSPFDHSRVKLKNAENDYINASLVTVEEAQRSYILSQGPLRNTCGHFWLMIWEQCTKAVIMLNRVIEKGSVRKCAQYWPTTEEFQMSFSDTGFAVRLLSEEDHSHYIMRVLELQNLKVCGCVVCVIACACYSVWNIVFKDLMILNVCHSFSCEKCWGNALLSKE
uniref:protein-tyrosine-phosphatase n=1 Tax=Gouania willdenowi TaxID=441366 RepID=A0A8C5GI91_GOUWI